MGEARAQRIEMRSIDGRVLAARRTEARGRTRALVVLAPATGAPARAYDAIASALAERGLTTVAFDYRGTGDSRPHDLRELYASMAIWGGCDLGGVVRELRGEAERQRLPLVSILHSISGLLVGMCADAGAFTRMVTVGAQIAFPLDQPPLHALGTLAMRHAFMPALTRLVGYFPARRLGLGEDLPRGVAMDWARRVIDPDGEWALQRAPTYFFDIRARLLALAATDDPYATPRALHRLHRRFVHAEVLTRRITPRELGVRRIGHLGLLGPRLADRVAPILEDALVG
jgi:predicted alpha/beta hydrolase